MAAYKTLERNSTHLQVEKVINAINNIECGAFVGTMQDIPTLNDCPFMCLSKRLPEMKAKQIMAIDVYSE